MRIASVLILVGALGLISSADSCTPDAPPQAASGVTRTRVHVPTGPDGLTVEQRNIGERLLEDNKPGSIKHLYVISAYSGQVIIYSTVRGKVTSSGKRLTPTTIAVDSGQYSAGGPAFTTGIGSTVTNEVLQDDGSYGSSMEYVYWWDTKGVYHQHYVQGGQIVHVSSEPLAVKSVIINMAATE